MSDLISKREVLQILESRGVLCNLAKRIIEELPTVDIAGEDRSQETGYVSITTRENSVGKPPLFRGQRLDNSEWSYGSLIPLENGGMAIIPEGEAVCMPSGPLSFGVCICREVDPSSVSIYEHEESNGQSGDETVISAAETAARLQSDERDFVN